jgi:hypothetical protein
LRCPTERTAWRTRDDSSARSTGEDLNPLLALDDGTQVSLDALEDILHKRVDALMDSLGKSTYGRRT